MGGVVRGALLWGVGGDICDYSHEQFVDIVATLTRTTLHTIHYQSLIAIIVHTNSYLTPPPPPPYIILIHYRFITVCHSHESYTIIALLILDNSFKRRCFICSNVIPVKLVIAMYIIVIHYHSFMYQCIHYSGVHIAG